MGSVYYHLSVDSYWWELYSQFSLRILLKVTFWVLLNLCLTQTPFLSVICPVLTFVLQQRCSEWISPNPRWRQPPLEQNCSFELVRGHRRGRRWTGYPEGRDNIHRCSLKEQKCIPPLLSGVTSPPLGMMGDSKNYNGSRSGNNVHNTTTRNKPCT